MTKHFEPDPLDELLAADPLADRLSPASLARIRARVSEDVMTTPTPRRAWGARHLGLGAGVAALGALALVLAVGWPPGASPVGSPGTGAGACVEPYSTTAITHRTFAFEGTVAAIDGEQVTFTVGTVYSGPASETITLAAPGMTGSAITPGGGPTLAVGQRYLVAGDDRFVWACGYTQPYDTTVAAEWQAALGG